MNRRKRVIFYINSDLQYSTEFNENTKIKMIKSYLKDVSHLEKFSLTHSNQNTCDELTINHYSNGNREIFFRVFMQDDKCTESQIEQLLKENSKLINKNNEINNILNNYKLEQGILKFLNRKS